MTNTKRIGDLGERIAEAFLRLRGYAILDKNLRYAGREIDLLAHKSGRLVAVEVKLRRSDRYGRAVEAVDRRKLARIRAALDGVLKHMGRPLSPQIDVIVIEMDRSKMVVRHVEAVY